jgi:hypothetical protein
MTRLQQIHWELDMDYLGHPYYVSGNAILHAIGQQLSQERHQQLHASHGIFVPGQFGTFPEEHSQQGFQPYLGTGLPDVDCYADLFIHRNPAHTWLLDSRPRDALNTHDIRLHSGHPGFAHETIMGRPGDARKQQQTTKWYLNAYLYADNDDILPIADSVLDGLQFGGKRNYGYGTTQLKATQLVNLDALDYSQLDDSDAYSIELVTPFVLESEYPNTGAQCVPSWWHETRSDLRERNEVVLNQCEAYELQTVDHDQVVTYTDNRPVETAKNGVLRVGSHSKYGFGELKVAPSQIRTE